VEVGVSAPKKLVLRFVPVIWNLVPKRVIYRAVGWWYPRNREPEILLVGELMPRGKAAVDIGVWYGPWTRALAQHASVVHAFEPQPDLCGFLRSVCEPNVVVHEMAMSDTTGPTELWTSVGAPVLNGLGSLEHSTDSMTPIVVIAEPLDASDIRDLGLLKIDVEGHEAAVLRGAEATIKRERPRIVIEIEQRHLDHPIEEIFDQIESLGYRGYALRKGRSEPLDQFELDRDQTAWIDRLPSLDYVNNFLFIADEDTWTPADEPERRRGECVSMETEPLSGETTD
jgi:FkbM family methyltransferase